MSAIELGEMPVPENDSDPLEGIAARLLAASDRNAVAFHADVLDAAAKLLGRDPGGFETLRATLKKAGIRVSVWEAAVRACAKDDAPRPVAESWRELLEMEDGRPKSTEANCITALTHAPEWKDVLAFDEFAQAVVKLRPPPWHRDDAPSDSDMCGTWTDADDTRTLCYFQRTLEMTPKPASIMPVVHMVAARKTFHPVREYLDGIAWDEVPRVAEWLVTYAGAVSQPSEYVQRVGAWFLIGAVARIYEPGCKVDTCIVLEGPQGARKSTLVRKLVPREDMFAEHNASLGDKDAYAILHGRWILELAELDSIAKTEMSKVKRYMTSAVDAYRPVYARRVVRMPRQCVFIGTVNESEYLRDSTGNRRWWPVAVGEINVEALERDRDQLWAEAVRLYREGARWYPEADDVALLTDEQEERYRPDAWEALIEEWLETWLAKPETVRGTMVTASEILTGAVHRNMADQGDGDARRVGTIMARLGWKRGRFRSVSDGDERESSGKRRRVPGYIPPTLAESNASALYVPGCPG